MLGDVRFQFQPGGLGRLPAGADFVSGLFAHGLTASPTAWADPLGKRYASVEEAEADGIVAASAAFGLLHYQIAEFFRIAGPSELWVVNAAHADFSAQNVFALTSGRLRQAYWQTSTAFSGLTAQVGAAKTFAEALENLHAPLVVLLAVADPSATVDGASQSDLRALNADRVAVLISGDATGKGRALADDLGAPYVPAAGAVLGAMARAKVSEHIGWVEKFDLSAGAELQETCFADGQVFGKKATAILEALHEKGYVFLRRHIGVAGAYVNDTPTCALATSDLAYLENVRTLQKAKREIRAALLPKLNAPLLVDADGKLAPGTVKLFENLAARPLSLMQAAAEVSNYAVFIDPEQDVLATSILQIVAKIQPVGVARYINVSIGFAVKIA